MRARLDRSLSLFVAVALAVAVAMPSAVAHGGGTAPGVLAVRRIAAAPSAVKKSSPQVTWPVRTSDSPARPARSVVDTSVSRSATAALPLIDPLAPSVPGELVVALYSGAAAATSERALESRGAVVEQLRGDAASLLVKIPPGVSDFLFTEVAKEAPGVAWVQPNYLYAETYVPADPRYSEQWGLPDIGAPAAWDVTRGKDTVLVAVVDTGVDYEHPDLVGQVDVANGYDFVNGDSLAMDDHGHGTHVAGIIAATMDNGIGGVGVAPESRILPVKALDSKGSGSSIGVAAGIRYAADGGARVINLSLAGPSDPTMADAVAYAQDKGCVVVAAAGNDNSSEGASYPAKYVGVVGVGAVASNNARAYFSNYGPDVDVAAPGLNILSTILGDSYGAMSGTSMASPFVAGVAGLVLAANPQLAGDPAAVIEQVFSTAAPLSAAGMGHGLVRADAAVESARPSPDDDIPGVPLAASPVTGTLNAGTDRDDVYPVYLVQGQTLDASLTGAAGTSFDLYLYGPGATNLADEASIVAGSPETPYPSRLTYVAPATGWYYLDLFALSGSGSYTLQWQRTDAPEANIPGVALPSSPFDASLAHAGDRRIYRVDLTAGQQFVADMIGPVGTDYDLWLFGPGSTSVDVDTPLVKRESSSNEEILRYKVTASGTYYLDVFSFAGSGPYEVTWSVGPWDPDDNIPGVDLPASPVASTVGGLTDDDDVYKVFLQAGQSIDMTLTNAPQPGPAGSYYPQLFVYPPTATDVNDGADGWESSTGMLPLSYEATSTGYHYLDVFNPGYPIDYSLEWSTFRPPDDNIPGVPAPPSPIGGTLGVTTDTDHVYSFYAAAGQWISASLTSPDATTTDFDLYLYAPGSTSTTGTPLAQADGGTYPKSIALLAPASGLYYLQAHAFAGQGAFSLAWSAKTRPPDDNIPGVPAPPSPIGGTLGVTTDTDYVCSFYAAAGQWISASLTSPDATTTDFDLYLYAPGSKSTTGTPLAQADGGTYPKSIALVAPASGLYYLQAHAFAGQGAFSLAWSARTFARVSNPVAPGKVTHGRHFTVYGYVAPKHAISHLVILKFYLRNSHGVWVYHHSVTGHRYTHYSSVTRSKYTASVSLLHKGKWRVRALHTDSGMPDVYSGYDTITVR